MQIITSEDEDAIQILINEFIVINQINSKESIPIELLNYLRKRNIKIEDGVLFNRMIDQIEKKLKGLKA